MAGLTDESVKQKLLALNDTQDSIMSTSQMLSFYHRHADRIARIWLQRVQDPNTNAAKRLNLMYLANEMVQQAKSKKKETILSAFQPFVADAMLAAYKGASPDIQNKLKRVSEVWRHRQVFDLATQESVEAHIIEADKARPQTQRKPLGGALFPTDGASVPSELQPLVNTQQTLSKAQLGIKPALDPANKAYTALTTTSPLPSAPVYAARLSTLAKELATAEAAVSETLTHRRKLIAGIEKLLHSNRTALIEEENQHKDIQTRRADVENKKTGVEDAIMRGLSSSEEMNDSSVHGTDLKLGEPPEIESFTPPPASPTPPHAELPPTATASAPAPEAQLSEVHPGDLQRSSTPPGMPPSYQYGHHNAGSFFQGNGTRTPEEVDPVPYDKPFNDPAPILEASKPSPPREMSTPPAAPMPNAASYLPESTGPAPPRAFSPPPMQSQPMSTLPGLGAPPPQSTPPAPSTALTSTSLDPRKRPSSAVNSSADHRKRPASVLNNRSPNGAGASRSGSGSSPVKKRRTSEDEFVTLPGLGGEGGMEGLDKEVVGMLG